MRFWQYWLLGTQFIVISDHKPLENLKLKSRTDEELGDMVYYLSQYSFTLRYSPGKTNEEADALSRNPVLEHFEDSNEVLQLVNLITLEEIKKTQETMTEKKNTYKKEGIQYRKIKDQERIVVTTEFGKKLINKVHLYYGHISANHIANKIRQFYYFTGMDNMIREYCGKCEICIQNKSRRNREIGLLSQLGPAEQPYEIMSLDTVGGFADNRSTKKYLHLLADHFTRHAFTSTSKGQSSKDFIKLLQPIVANNKIKILLTDQYPAIKAREFQEFLNAHGITIVYTAVDCPASNGLNERLNQTLVNRIRCKMREKPNKAWSTIATECTKEYNQSIHSATKFAPEYLLTGKDSRIVPIELEIKRNLREDRQTAFKNSQKNHLQNKTRTDQGRKEVEINVGDYVFIENGNKLNRNKLDPIRSGPYKVKEQVSDHLYKIDLGNWKNKNNLFHTSKLVACRQGRPF